MRVLDLLKLLMWGGSWHSSVPHQSGKRYSLLNEVGSAPPRRRATGERSSQVASKQYSNNRNIATPTSRAQNWVAVEELNLSYYMGGTLLFSIIIYPYLPYIPIMLLIT